MIRIKVSSVFQLVLIVYISINRPIMGTPDFISDEQIQQLLNWDSLIPAIEEAMGDLSKNEVIQPARLIMEIPQKNGAFLAMPAFSASKEALGCKIVTSFRDNQQKGLPSIIGTILFMDSDTGKLKVVMEGTEITTWRTAAASVAATKNLHKGDKKVLAILGAGTQGRIHAIAMKHYFNFTEVRIWNRTPEKAKKLCEILGPWAKHYTEKKECVKDADVIVTATYAPSPIVMLPWVKEGAHINAIGFGVNHHSELDLMLYKDNGTKLFVDHMEAAIKELKGLTDSDVKIVAEVGQVINNDVKIPMGTKVTIFHSLGMAIEDVIAAKLVYDSYLKAKNSTEAIYKKL